MQQELLSLLDAREGHFKLESGYHGNLWFDLDLLFLRPVRVQPFIAELANRLTTYNIDGICGPLIGGALIAEILASRLDVEFYYTERLVRSQQGGLYPVEYRLPDGVKSHLDGKRVAIVDDIINAGSAVRGTCTSLIAANAQPVVIGCLLEMGAAAPAHFAAQKIPFENIASLHSALWKPSECPLCASEVPLQDFTPDSPSQNPTSN